ncbi:MAG: outer membrane beta-barrel protein [Treponema sp.]|nr:outer membrane beta-barrel protein [Treponema sp.]
MKRRFLVLALAMCVAGGAFAQSLFSAGAGGILNYGKIGEANVSMDMLGLMKLDASASVTALNFGGFVFFDATFVDLSIAFLTGPITTTMETSEIPGIAEKVNEEAKGTMMSLDFTLLGKYPITISDNFTFYPLLGAGYNYVLSAKDEDGNDIANAAKDESASDWSTFRIHVGIGGDFDLTDTIYLRGQLLGNYTFAPKTLKDSKDLADRLSAELSNGGLGDLVKPTIDANGAFGGTFKIAVGFRF